MTQLSPGTHEAIQSDALLGRIDLATRPIEFDTNDPDWLLATNGGTLFLIEFEGVVFAITCGHVFKDFDWAQLRIPLERAGVEAVYPTTRYRPEQPSENSVDAEIMDIVALELPAQSFSSFIDPPYKLVRDEVVDCEEGDEVYAAGYLRYLSSYLPDERKYALLQMTATVQARQYIDVTRRLAIGQAREAMPDLAGISGSPVVRRRDRRVCGIITRAGSAPDNVVKLHFVEFSDVLHLLDGRKTLGLAKRYEKLVLTPKDHET